MELFLLFSPFERVKHEIYGPDNERESHQVVPAQGFFQEEYSKERKYYQGYHFLYGFELERRVSLLQPVTVVGRHHKQVFEKGNAPADKYQLNQWHICNPLLQMAIPGIGHKAVGDGKQCYCPHKVKIYNKDID